MPSTAAYAALVNVPTGLLKGTYNALRRYRSLPLACVSDILAAAQVLLHCEHY